MRIACWVPTATNTHTGCVVLTGFPLQQWLHEHTSMLSYTYIACRVKHLHKYKPYSNLIRDKILQVGYIKSVVEDFMCSCFSALCNGI
jgi:hypothetical protein